MLRTYNEPQAVAARAQPLTGLFFHTVWGMPVKRFCTVGYHRLPIERKAEA